MFFGAYDPTTPPLGLSEKLIRSLPAASNALPSGDFRDWDTIEDWATEIAKTLSTDTPPEATDHQDLGVAMDVTREVVMAPASVPDSCPESASAPCGTVEP